MSKLIKDMFAMEEDDVVTPNTVVEITPDGDDTLDSYDESNDLASDADEIGVAIEQCLDVVGGCLWVFFSYARKMSVKNRSQLQAN